MYADDIIIYCTCQDIGEAMEILREAYVRIGEHLIELSLELSPGKTKFTVFSRNRKTGSAQFSVDLDETTIQASPTMKYLGVTLNQKLLWHPHINENIIQPKRSLNIIRVLAGVSWGPSSSIGESSFSREPVQVTLRRWT